jgi:hypothetical protein
MNYFKKLLLTQKHQKLLNGSILVEKWVFALNLTLGLVLAFITPIFKQPKTDSGKNSHKGLLCVTGSTGKYVVEQNVTPEREASDDNMLKTVFKDGKMIKTVSLSEIRANIEKNLLLA